MNALQETGLIANLAIDQRRGVRPCYVDGRCSTKTYLVVASRKEDGNPTDNGRRIKNLIGVRKLSDNSFRWHAYPDWKFFNMEMPVMASTSYHNNEYGYDSSILDAKATKALLGQLNTSRGLHTASMEQLFPVIQRGFDPNNDAVDKLPPKQSY